MLKKITFGILLILSYLNTHAQHTALFAPELPKATVANSLYNSFNFLDARADTSLGFVQTGAFNRRAKVVTKKPFSQELSAIFNSLIGANAGTGEMLFHLRQFSFAELTGAMSEVGYLALEADVYARKQDSYQLIGSMDTLIRIRSSIDVTNPLFRMAGDTLSGFIRSRLSVQPSPGPSYSHHDLLHIDSIEKAGIKLYASTTYNDGLYLSYNSFKNQTPDQDINVTNDLLEPGNVKALNEKGKLKDIKMNKTYAVVYKGAPHIVTQYGFYPLKRENNDFKFTGKAKVNANLSTVMVASAMFGVLGALMAGSGNEANFEMKIDHRKGTFIKLKEIAEPQKAANSNPDAW